MAESRDTTYDTDVPAEAGTSVTFPTNDPTAAVGWAKLLTFTVGPPPGGGVVVDVKIIDPTTRTQIQSDHGI